VVNGIGINPWDGNYTVGNEVSVGHFYIFLLDNNRLGTQNFSFPLVTIEPFFGCNVVCVKQSLFLPTVGQT